MGIEHLRRRSLLCGTCNTARNTRSAAAHPHGIFAGDTYKNDQLFGRRRGVSGVGQRSSKGLMTIRYATRTILNRPMRRKAAPESCRKRTMRRLPRELVNWWGR